MKSTRSKFGALVLALLLLIAAPAGAQDARSFWLNRLSELLAHEPSANAAYERWMGEWFAAVKPSGGLASAVSGNGHGRSAPSVDFWGSVGDASVDLVNAAFVVARDTWMRDQENPAKLARFDEVLSLRDRLLAERSRAAGSSAYGRRVTGGWDRDGDGVADVVDTDGDGAPDTYVGGSNPASYMRPRVVAPIVGNAIRGKQFNALTWPAERSRAERRREGDAAGATGEGRRAGPTGDALANLPTLREVTGIATTLLEEATTLDRAVTRLAAGGADASVGTNAVAAAERLRVLTSELVRIAPRLADELGAPDVDEEGALRALRGLGDDMSAAEVLIHRSMTTAQRAGSRDAALDRVRASLEALFPEFESTAQMFVDALGAMGYDVPRLPSAEETPGVTAPPAGAASLGTGFAVGDGRCVLTNAHVVGAAETVQVTLASGEVVEGRVIANGAARRLDLALIELPRSIARGLPFAPDAAREGVPVWAVGYGEIKGAQPLCLWTDGTISAVQQGTLVFSATVNPGNSGGPLVDARGSFVGVVVAKSYANVEEAVDSMSFAIPGALAHAFLTEHGVQVERVGGVSNGSLPERDRVRAATVMIIARQP